MNPITPPAGNRIKDILGKLALSFGSILFAFIILEISLRIFYPQPWEARPLTISKHDTLFRFNEIFGWEYTPNSQAQYVLPYEHVSFIKINSAGMRDRNYALAKPVNKKRIVAVGDSFTTGLEVDAPEVFTEVMEDKILENCEVLNFGLGGFGPIQEYLMLTRRAINYKPDVVILAIYIRNDFDDILGTYTWIRWYRRPMVSIDKNGRMVFDNLPLHLPKEKIIYDRRKNGIFSPTNFHVYNFLRSRLVDKENIDEMAPEVRILKKQYSDDMKKAYSIMFKVLQETQLFTKKNNAKFVVVIIPTIVQVYHEEFWGKIKKIYHLKDEDYDFTLPDRMIKEACVKSGIYVLDLMPGFRARALSGNDLYYRRNQHWNKNGHLAAAEEISKFLINNKIIEN